MYVLYELLCPWLGSNRVNKPFKPFLNLTTLNSNEHVRNPVTSKHIGREGHLLQAIGFLAPYHQRKVRATKDKLICMF